MKYFLNYLVKKLCEMEKGKKQINAGDAREVLSAIKKLTKKDPEFCRVAIRYILG